MSDRKRWAAIMRQIEMQGYVKDAKGNLVVVGSGAKVGMGKDGYPCLILAGGRTIEFAGWGKEYTL